MDVRSSEPELRALMIAGLDGDAAGHRALLEKLSGQLRAYFKGQLSRIGRGPVEAEDLVQEALIAIHTRRHTIHMVSKSHWNHAAGVREQRKRALMRRISWHD